MGVFSPRLHRSHLDSTKPNTLGEVELDLITNCQSIGYLTRPMEADFSL
jgi:hypothetical protein